MSEDKQDTIQKTEVSNTANTASQANVEIKTSTGVNFSDKKKRFSFGAGKGNDRRGRRGDRRDKKEPEEFEQKIVDLARVTRVMAGGKRMRFRACVVIGDKKGRVAVGLAKSADVSEAIAKAVEQAKKQVVNVQIIKGTIAHEIKYKYGAGLVLLKPAKQGSGIIAGGPVRIVLELAGLNNVVSKIMGTNNPVTNVKCVIEALKSLKRIEFSQEKKNTEQKIKQPQLQN